MEYTESVEEPIDVLIVGSGAAGLTAALALAEKRRVLVLAKGGLSGGSTAWAQGELPPCSIMATPSRNISAIP